MAGIRTRSRPNLGDESEFGKTGCAARRHHPANHGNSLASANHFWNLRRGFDRAEKGREVISFGRSFLPRIQRERVNMLIRMSRKAA